MENINPLEEIIDKEEEKRIFRELAKIDGLHEYFRALMARDMRLFFNCQKDQQELAKGAYHRTEWLSKMVSSNSVDNS